MTIGEYRPKWGNKDFSFQLEIKAVRRVRTPAGAKRFGVPIGSIIIPGRNSGLSLRNLKVGKVVQGFDEVESTGNRKGTFYVGKYDGEDIVCVTDVNDKVLHEAKTPEEAFGWLETHANGGRKPAVKKPVPKQTDARSGAGKKPAAKKPASKKPAVGKLPNREANVNAWQSAMMKDNDASYPDLKKNAAAQRVLRAGFGNGGGQGTGGNGALYKAYGDMEKADRELVHSILSSTHQMLSGEKGNQTYLEKLRVFLNGLNKTHRAAIKAANTKSEMFGAMDYKTVPVSDFKAIDGEDSGIVEAFVAVTGVKDNVNDIIEPGAFQKSLMTRNPKGVWHHNITESISRTLDVKELAPGDPGLPDTLPNGDPWPSKAGALLVKTLFNQRTQRGRDAYEDVKFFGADQEWSIGYNVPTGGATIDRKTGIRTISTLDLYEYSPVLFGAMPNARTKSVKSAQFSWKQLMDVDVEEIKGMIDEVNARDFALETKAAKKEDDEDDDFVGDDDAAEDDDDSAEVDPEYDEEEDDEDDEDEEKSWDYSDLDFKSVEAVENAIYALEELKAVLIDGYKSDDEGDDTAADLSSLVAEAGLDCEDSASEFDDAVASGDTDVMDEAGGDVLDAVEAAADSEDADTAALNKVAQYIASAFQTVEGDAGEDDEDMEGSEDDTELKGANITIDTKSFLTALED